MKEFKNKVAVVTGAGAGIGRELARQLVSEGCHVALCDVLMDNLAETHELCSAAAMSGSRISIHECDVSEEEQVGRFRDEVEREHQTSYINLLFNNAGVSGGGSFLIDDRAVWDKTFDVSWGGVYLCCRAFMPMLVASEEGHVVNTSSVNGFYACLGPGTPHTAYSAAKFAIKGFTEALIVDLRLNAPHVQASVVMPGHIGTDIALNSDRIHGRPSLVEMTAEELAATRERVDRSGNLPDGITDDEFRAHILERRKNFRENAPTTPAQAATAILDAVRNGEWRVLVGDDAKLLDEVVRKSPDRAYDPDFF